MKYLTFTLLLYSNLLIGQKTDCTYWEVDSMLQRGVDFSSYDQLIATFSQRDKCDISILYIFEPFTQAPPKTLHLCLKNENIYLIDKMDSVLLNNEAFELKGIIGKMKFGSTLNICQNNQVLTRRLILVKIKEEMFYKYEGFCDSFDLLQERNPDLYLLCKYLINLDVDDN